MSTPGLLSLTDASLVQSHVLPAAKSLVTQTASIDLGAMHNSSARYQLVDVLLAYPALALAKLPNTSVITYQVIASADPTFATGVVVIGQATQTGVTGTASTPAGALRLKLPADCPEYLAATAATDANGADCSAASMTLSLAF